MPASVSTPSLNVHAACVAHGTTLDTFVWLACSSPSPEQRLQALRSPDPHTTNTFQIRKQAFQGSELFQQPSPAFLSDALDAWVGGGEGLNSGAGTTCNEK